VLEEPVQYSSSKRTLLRLVIQRKELEEAVLIARTRRVLRRASRLLALLGAVLLPLA